MCVVDYAGATGDREDDVQVDLRVRVGHFPEVNMTLLGAYHIHLCGTYKHVAPTALPDASSFEPSGASTLERRLRRG
jgi:hypothetical protein